MKKVFCSLILSVSLTGCSVRYLDVEPAYAAIDCPVNDERLVSLENQGQFESLVERKNTLGLDVRVSLPQLDFANNTYVLVAAGSKPHGGFRIELTADKARLEGSTLYLPVEIVKPDPGMAQIQMMTSPCRVLGLPKVRFKHVKADAK